MSSQPKFSSWFLAQVTLSRLIDALYTDLGTLSFVQVGSNDADVGDPLRPSILKGYLRGVMVEPLPHIFERLKSNYQDVSGLQFEQVAIAAERKTLPFYYVAEAAPEERALLPEWYDQIGSFDRNHLLRHSHLIPQLEQRIQTAKLSCITFDDLCTRTGVTRFDILHVDAEGYDLEIMRTIDLRRYQPRLVVFEMKHIPKAELETYRQTLSRDGYTSILMLDDIVCLRTGPWLLGAWRTMLAWLLLRREQSAQARRKSKRPHG